MKLIIRADDLGFTEGVNYGISKAVHDGLVTSVGIMMNMPSAKHGYDLIKDRDIALGVHTNICVGKPLVAPEKIPSLVQPNGQLCSSKEIRSRTVDTVVFEEAYLEVEAQLKAFIDMVGRKPDYLEAHAVTSKNLYKALKAVARDYDVFYENVIMDPEWEKENNLYGWPLPVPGKDNTYDVKEHLDKAYEMFKDHERCVVVFHPGYVDQDIIDLSSFNLIRPCETKALCSDWMKQWLEKRHIERIDFRDIKTA